MEDFIEENSTSSSSSKHEDDELQLQWAAIQRLPEYERLRFGLLDNYDEDGKAKGKKVADVGKLSSAEHHLFIENLIKNVEGDHLRLLEKLRDRIKK